MTHVYGIVVHQTGAATAKSTLASYRNPGANGAHFLIDKNGHIYQTGSVYAARSSQMGFQLRDPPTVLGSGDQRTGSSEAQEPRS